MPQRTKGHRLPIRLRKNQSCDSWNAFPTLNPLPSSKNNRVTEQTALNHVSIVRARACVCVCVCFGRHSTDVRYDEIGCVEDLSVLLLKVSSIPSTFLVYCRVFSVAWGRTSRVPPSRKHISCFPTCLLHGRQFGPGFSTRRLKKCISCVPRALLHVCHTETRSNLTNRREVNLQCIEGHHTHTQTHTYRHTHHTTHHTTPHIHTHHTHTHTTHTHTPHHTHTHTPTHTHHT